MRTRLPPPPDPSSAAACTPPASVTVMSLQVSSFKLSRWCASSEGLSGEETGRFMKTGEITGLAAGFVAALGVGMTKGETRESMFSTSELTECSRWGGTGLKWPRLSPSTARLASAGTSAGGSAATALSALPLDLAESVCPAAVAPLGSVSSTRGDQVFVVLLPAEGSGERSVLREVACSSSASAVFLPWWLLWSLLAAVLGWLFPPSDFLSLVECGGWG